jgi:hypothetical protein
VTARLDYYTRRPHRLQADLDLGGDGDALALHGRLQDVAFLDGGILPVEPAEIRRRAGVSAALWRAWPGKVERKWPVSPDGSGRANADLDEELDRVHRWRAERAASGKKGAAKRWRRDGSAKANPRLNSRAKANPKLSDGSAIALDSELSGVELSGVERSGVERSGGRARASRRASPPFAPPSVEEVEQYAEEAKLGAFNAAVFVDFYESKGWKVGAQPMKSWKAAARSAARKGWTTEKAPAAPAPARPIVGSFANLVPENP